MATRTHRIVMDGGGRSADWLTKKAGKVAKKVFQVGLNTQLRHGCRSPAWRVTKKNVLVGLQLGDGQRIEVDVNDPDFWSKVSSTHLPAACITIRQAGRHRERAAAHRVLPLGIWWSPVCR